MHELTRDEIIRNIKDSIKHIPEHDIGSYNRIDYENDTISVMEAKVKKILNLK